MKQILELQFFISNYFKQITRLDSQISWYFFLNSKRKSSNSTFRRQKIYIAEIFVLSLLIFSIQTLSVERLPPCLCSPWNHWLLNFCPVPWSFKNIQRSIKFIFKADYFYSPLCILSKWLHTAIKIIK